MRNFKREPLQIRCGLIIENRLLKAAMLNFSRMGALIKTRAALSKKMYVSLVYQNEKNETIRMLTYVVYTTKRGNNFNSGLQFVGIEERN